MNKQHTSAWRMAAILTGIVLGLLSCHAARGQSFTDDFDDGNDTGWTKYDVLRPFGFGGSFTFPGGNTYRLETPGNYSVADLGGGRVGSLVTGSNYSDFRLSVDVVDWNDDREYVFGPIARTTQAGLGTTDGYLVILNSHDMDFQLLRIENEAPNTNEMGDVDVVLPTNSDFRIVFSGLGTQLNAIAYDLANLNTPLGGFVVDAANYGPPPTPAPYTTGSVGLIVAQADSTTSTPFGHGPPYGATFDNFKVAVPSAGEWNAPGGGLSSEAFNWVGNVTPLGAGAHAKFLKSADIDAEVTIDGFFYTLGKITFDNTHTYKISGAPIILEDTGNAEITVLSGSHEIAAPLSLSSNVRVSGTGTLILSGAIGFGGKSIELAGGNLRLAKISDGALNVTGGTASLLPASGTSVFNSLSIAGGATPTGKFDVTNNPAVINYSGASPVASVRSQILAGRGGSGFGATWTGQGITSSTAAAANVTEPESRSVGYAENSALPLGAYTMFRGQPVDDTSVLIAYTRTADANLDGVVNDDDVTIVGATYAPGVPNPHWALGDFDYNGFVDDDDVTLLGVFYNPSAPPLVAPTAGNLAAVPEPASLTLLALGCAVPVMRWRQAARRRGGTDPGAPGLSVG